MASCLPVYMDLIARFWLIMCTTLSTKMNHLLKAENRNDRQTSMSCFVLVFHPSHNKLFGLLRIKTALHVFIRIFITNKTKEKRDALLTCSVRPPGVKSQHSHWFGTGSEPQLTQWHLLINEMLEQKQIKTEIQSGQKVVLDSTLELSQF